MTALWECCVRTTLTPIRPERTVSCVAKICPAEKPGVEFFSSLQEITNRFKIIWMGLMNAI